MDEYKKALQMDATQTAAWYESSLVKTEQQKFLETLLRGPYTNIADIGCGAGTLSYHLRHIYPEAHFTLVDYNEDARAVAIKNNPGCTFYADNMTSLGSISTDSQNLTCCWQTLSWMNSPRKALEQLLRITHPGGQIFASALFNLDHDVDVWANVHDHTRPSGKAHVPLYYNTYSAHTVGEWLEGWNWKILPFETDVLFAYTGRGLGTSTIRDQYGRLIQKSGGMLLNWGVLQIDK